MRKVCVLSVGALILSSFLSACRSPRPQPTALPFATSLPTATALPPASVLSGGPRCSPLPGAVWHSWRTAQNPLAVYALLADGDTLWAGTSFGVWRVSSRTGDYTAYSEIGPVSRLLPLGDGPLWAASVGRVFYFDGQRWFRLQLPHGVEGLSVNVCALEMDNNGDLWTTIGLGSECSAADRYPGHVLPANGLWGADSGRRLTPGELAICQEWQAVATGSYAYHSFSECEALNLARRAVSEITEEPTLLAVDGDQSAWWATNNMLGHLAGGRSITLTLPVGQVYALAPDPAHGVWIGTDRGLAYSDGKNLRWVPLGLDLCGFQGEPHDIAVDAQGVVWATTESGIRTLAPGKLNWQPFTNPGLSDPDATRLIQAIAAAPEGGIWATHAYDLWRFGGPRATKPQPPGECPLYQLAVDRMGNVWSAAGVCGVPQFIPSTTGGRWVRHDKLGKNYVFNIALSNDGTVYAIGMSGLFSYAGTVTQKAPGISAPVWNLIMPPPNEQWRTETFAMAADNKDGVWIGASQAGVLWHCQAGQFEWSNQPFETGSLQQLYVDPQNRLWVGLRDELAVYDGKTWKRISTPVGTIRKLTGGPDGRIWVLGSDAIAVYDPAADK